MIARRMLAAALSALVVSSASVALAQTGPQVTAAASPTTSGAIEVVWTPVEAAVGYLVVPQRLTSTGTWQAVDGRTQRVTAVRPVVFDGLVNGTTYRGCVAAVLPDGFRTAVSDAAVPYGLPGVPVITETTRDGTELTVTWTPPAANGRPITSYTVTLSPATVQAIVVGGDQTTLTIEGLEESTEYTVTVRATNLRGQGEQVQSETIPATATPGPVGATVLQVSTAAGPCAGQISTAAPRDPGVGSDPTTDAAQGDPGDTEKPQGGPTDPATEAAPAGEGTRSAPSPGPRPTPRDASSDGEAEPDRPDTEVAPGVEPRPEAPAPERAEPDQAPPVTSASDEVPPRSVAWLRWTLAGLLVLVLGAAAVPAVRSRRSAS